MGTFMKRKGEGKSSRNPRDISGQAAVDAALWSLAEVLAEVAANPIENAPTTLVLKAPAINQDLS
jgi:hypothetical protein